MRGASLEYWIKNMPKKEAGLCTALEDTARLPGKGGAQSSLGGLLWFWRNDEKSVLIQESTVS